MGCASGVPQPIDGIDVGQNHKPVRREPLGQQCSRQVLVYDRLNAREGTLRIAHDRDAAATGADDDRAARHQLLDHRQLDYFDRLR
jgi:hypothetical protein